MGAYFQDFSEDEQIHLLVQREHPTKIWYMIKFHKGLNKTKIVFNETVTYEYLRIEELEIEYIMLDLSIITKSLKENISTNFDELYSNNDYFFGKKNN